MISYKIIGLMSGTSLDGLDLCLANFECVHNKWHFDILHTKTIPYQPMLLNQLQNAVNLSGLDLFLLDRELGFFFGREINQFISEFKIENVDAIASHGHTIFHQPDKFLTVQIGCGATIAKETGIQVINDFRKKDVIHGGQGAPLVPIGDQKLFSAFADSFLNIGGFANFSVLSKENIKAFDICPTNCVINFFTRKLGLEYDSEGNIARSISFDSTLLEKLNNLAVYQEQQPPSMGWEWVEQTILPLYDLTNISLEEKISTATEHAAIQIAKRLNENNSQSVYITGGGAKNSYLIERISHHFKGECIIPSSEIIDFKEALIFAFLGALYLENIPNCVPSVTGASKAIVGGVLHKV